jgi:hypothetical protein
MFNQVFRDGSHWQLVNGREQSHHSPTANAAYFSRGPSASTSALAQNPAQRAVVHVLADVQAHRQTSPRRFIMLSSLAYVSGSV